MQLQQLLNIHGNIDWRGQSKEAQVEGIYFDSRQVQPFSIYVAIKGTASDGHAFIGAAIENGALALVVEDSSQIPTEYQGAIVEVLDTRLSLQVLSQKYYQSPGDSMISVAVTGTNGKTSSSYILEYLFKQVNMKCGVIGTINHHVGDKVWKTNLTSPDPVTLQSRLKDFLDEGANSFVIEASSHALYQKRLRQSFDVTLFTNLSHDHLDYHNTMEEYFEAKAILFSQELLKANEQCFAVINGDDPYGRQMAQRSVGRRVFRFGQEDDNDIVFKILESGLEGCRVHIDFPNGQVLEFQNPMIGEHNVYNTVGCLGVLYSFGLDFFKAAQELSHFSGVPGRMQSIKSPSGVYGFVDYAHTPDALQKALDSLNALMTKDHRLILVFGCGGDRDKEKRPVMGKIGLAHADLMIVTSDNPRGENPQNIIDDIVKGLGPTEVHSSPIALVDRKEAIRKATEMAQPGDVILVAGKGHEPYQIIGDKILDFDDAQVLNWFLRKAEQK